MLSLKWSESHAQASGSRTVAFPLPFPQMSTIRPRFAAVQLVSQLDAQRLDDERIYLFQTSLRHSLRFFPQSTLEIHIPELRALLRLFFHLNTILIQKPSPGNAFQNLRYTPLTNLQRAAHLFLDPSPLHIRFSPTPRRCGKLIQTYWTETYAMDCAQLSRYFGKACRCA